MILQKKHRRTLAALGALGLGSTALSVQSVSADMVLQPNVNAGDFDLTKQATDTLKFPVEFDRPSGVNAAALAGTVTQLGSSSELYQNALEAVPELGNTPKMNSLLGDALNEDSPNYLSARQTIVKLIDWYNGLGGEQITTQSGEAFTTDNLNDPINVIAVAFSNKNNINQNAADTLKTLNEAQTVSDVMKALDEFQSGVSTGYVQAFNTYRDKVYAEGADLNTLSQYTQLQPVLNAYEKMYSDGASAIRKQLLAGSAHSTEAGVTFFESAVISGPTEEIGGGDSSQNTPEQKEKFITRWVDENGNALKPPFTSEEGFSERGTFDGYTFVSEKTDGQTKTYTFKKDTPAPVEKTADTIWVTETGEVLREKETGTFPDNGETTLFEGYAVISTNTSSDEDGNLHTVNTYHKIVSDTVWVDEEGNELKPKQEGEFPDNDGVSDIEGYQVISVRTQTDPNGDRHIINTYRKAPEVPAETPKHTTWVDENGNELKPKQEGQHPDQEGDDVPGYTLIEITTDENGNVTNIYRKNPEPKPEQPEVKIHTYWFDTEGNTLKPRQEGAHPDTDKNDIPTHTWVDTHVIVEQDILKGGLFEGLDFTPGDVINLYEKKAEPTPEPTPEEKKIITEWVDESGNHLKESIEGSHPDNDGVSDIPGYAVIEIKTDPDGNVTNVYRKLPEDKKIITNWIDEEGNVLKPSEEGEHPDIDGNDIPGYEFIRTETDDDGNINNVYRKLPEDKKVITNWVDKNGTVLKPAEEGEHPDTDGNDIPGYRLINIEKDDDGNINNIYEKIEDIEEKITHTKWVDERGIDLKPMEEGEHPDVEGDDIPGYKLLRTEKDDEGNIINVYEKIIMTHWVDENGQPLQESREGAHPDKEGDDIKGYTLIRTHVDEDGNVYNIYKMNTKDVETHWEDKSGKALANPETGETFGDPKNFNGYKLVDTKISEDGTRKTYVYEKVEEKPKEATPTPSAAKSQAKTLPQTGVAEGATWVGMAGASGLAGTTSLRRRLARRKKRQ